MPNPPGLVILDELSTHADRDRALVYSTSQVRTLAREADRAETNRRVRPVFLETLDPDGVHVVNLFGVHNDVEVRVQVLCKVRDSLEPTTVWLDVPVSKAILPTALFRLPDGEWTTANDPRLSEEATDGGS